MFLMSKLFFIAGNVDLVTLEENPEAIYDLLDSIDSEIELDSESDEEIFTEAPEETELPENLAEDLQFSDSDSDDDIPLASYLASGWKTGSFPSKEDPLEHTSTNSVLTPWQYFQKYLGDEFFSMGARHTAQYYFQKTGKVLNVSPTDIKKFFGLHAIMGCIHFPRIHMYWSSKFKFDLVSDVMPRDKFYLLRVNFHVVDVLGIPNEIQKQNRLWKFQPMIDMIRNRCRAMERKSRSSYSIDEQMIPFLGRCPVRQFVRNKPRPVGLKNFVLTTSEGKVLDFEIYQGKTTPFEHKELGLGPAVVLHLVQTLPKGSYIFFDRYFSTESLLNRLVSLDIYGTGTIMTNRLKGCTFKKDKEMKRGTSQELIRNDNKICATKWMDNKSVLMISTAFGSEPQEIIKRWDKTNKKHIDVTCPKVVRIYNKKMGGVDVCDQMIEYYRSFFKTKKWTLKVILHLFDMVIVNSWMEYKEDFTDKKKKPMDLLDFRLSLGEYLISSGPKEHPMPDINADNDEISEEEPPRKKKTPSTMPCEDKRYDGYQHWPINEDLKHPLRCRLENCDSRSRVKCVKCDVYLCFTKHKNCYVKFHTK